MLEILLLLCIAGVVMSAHKNLGLGNPYSIYFLIWTFIITILVLQQKTFNPVSLEFGLLMITAKSLVIAQLLLVSRGRYFDGTTVSALGEAIRLDGLRLAQVVVLLAVPVAYARAKELAGGEDIFSVVGYITLRASMTVDGQAFGITSYVSILSYVTTSLAVAARAAGRIRTPTVVLFIATSLFYAYVGTARTGILLLVACSSVPLIVLGLIRGRGISVALLVIAGLFSVVALMTGKGLSGDASVAENLATYMENLRSYTAAPLVAFNQLVAVAPTVELGANTFRFALSLFYAIDLVDSPPVALIREYAFVPDATNVYTVYEAYFRDFSLLGIFVPPAFMAGHWWLYRKAQSRGGRWIFYYAASIYPLIMQFFQDQYFSLMSMWIQLAFWYSVLMRSDATSGPVRVANA